MSMSLNLVFVSKQNIHLVLVSNIVRYFYEHLKKYKFEVAQYKSTNKFSLYVTN